MSPSPLPCADWPWWLQPTDRRGVIPWERSSISHRWRSRASVARFARQKLPAKKKVTFGVHSAVADHYGVDPENFPPDATTLDYVVAAAGG